MSHLRQGDYEIRCEWGPHGLKALLDDSDVIVIVDVLSFTTCVDVALARHAIVHPFIGSDQQAITFAQEKQAILGKKRPQSISEFSLSPASLQHLPHNSHIVLPSPNGSTLSLMTENTITLAGCLRNAQAVAEYAQTQGQRITIIPAGERFIYSDTDSALRPSLEDWIGAGAIISYLEGDLSPEAQTATYVFEAHLKDLLEVLQDCVSGQELIQKGYGEDIIIASQLNTSNNTPQIINHTYQNPA